MVGNSTSPSTHERRLKRGRDPILPLTGFVTISAICPISEQSNSSNLHGRYGKLCTATDKTSEGGQGRKRENRNANPRDMNLLTEKEPIHQNSKTHKTKLIQRKTCIKKKKKLNKDNSVNSFEI